ncbi:MAG: 2-keto-3-deoxy-L-rhamnonate aldolase [bacterium ADurb.Bin429]|nr:MAG: 2-keto-3-deoxy-L-rhamnonate aldolase [bacterium ADurb.Bin429]
MHMRHSRVLQMLRAGETVYTFKLNTNDPRIAEIVAMSGFPCIWLDQEHTTGDWSALETQIYAAKAHDADVMVRVPRGPYSAYSRPLELDAAGLMVPHIMSLADARAVVRATRFQPIGRRAVDGGNADGAYCGVEFKQYLLEANRQRFICIQIEDPEPLDELDAICALDGVDIIFFGPGDFSHGIGDPGNFANPRLLDARRRVAECALAHGKWAGTTGSPETAEELRALGYRFINIGADVHAIWGYCKEKLAGVGL